ncbi:heavy metal sensor histidine kinase [Comamonas testosteroni]|uniref:heavy metal sensor histidine kinase n=1 Tax=Comamonas testosteroni TaxID=285 RepID=UPI0002D3ABBF|nr:heavy metal sensor histidine kinase [Comamonas testosteroni]
MNTKSVPHLAGRLARVLALQTIVGLGLVCIAVYLVISITLTERQQDTLDHKQTAIENLLKQGRALHSSEAIKHLLKDYLTGHDELSLKLVSVAGDNIVEVPRGSENAGHVLSRRFTVNVIAEGRGVEPMQAILLLDRRPDERLLSRLGWTLGLAAVAGGLLVSLASTWLVRVGLKPLRSLVEQTRNLSANDLNRRLDDSHQPQELRPLVAQFNALLDRLAKAYQQMEAFNADVAHELNTPLTTLISSSELALRKPRSGPELQEALASNLEDLRRMAGIVADMLFLSNADRGVEARRTNVASLAELAFEVAEFHEAAIQEAQLQVVIVGDASATVDARLLRRALSNLLGNATRYAERGSTIQVEIARSNVDSSIRIAVINNGTEIDPIHLPRLFDRFYRADSSRTQANHNHGLGLTIVAAIARMHGGTTFATSSNRTTTIGVSFS